MERMLEHVSRTTWRGVISSASCSGYARQPLCGDELWIDVAVVDGIISQVRYRGQGCAVSQACASMVCEGAERQAVERVLSMTAEELMDFTVTPLSGWKQKCALLGWEALRMALLTERKNTSEPHPKAGQVSHSDPSGPTTAGIPP